MFASLTSVALVGVVPRAVRVEVHISGRQPTFSIVGLPDTAVREAKERVRASLLQAGYAFPATRVVVNLAPADLPKAGSTYDLPIALAVLVASGAIPAYCADAVALGELALDGEVRAVRGALGAAVVARRLGTKCIVPADCASELRGAGDDQYAVESLAEAVAAAAGEPIPKRPVAAIVEAPGGPDLRDVRGQDSGRRALEVAAAGGHHLLFTGPPGAGKTMLARCLPGLLPRLEEPESMEVALAWAAAGRARPNGTVPPFRSPHHSATLPALVGGGSGVPVPGEITLAHRGVLFLDELGEFPAQLLDALRQPLEEGSVTVARKGAVVTFPSSVQLVAATNPCPCGYQGDRLVSCICTPGSVERYKRRLSGPLLDRFDLRVRIARLDGDDLAGGPGEASASVRSRVEAARRFQQMRGCLNRDLARRELDDLEWEAAGLRRLEKAVATVALSGRGWDRARRVARTIADLAESPIVKAEHVEEALALRGPR